MGYPLSAASRRILLYAEEEAASHNHSCIGTEHLLLGLLIEDDPVAANVLQRRGVTLDKVRVVARFFFERGQAENETPGSGDTIALDPLAKQIVELAGNEAAQVNHPEVTPVHLLLALTSQRMGLGVGLIEAFATYVELVRSGVLRATATLPAEADPSDTPIVG